MQLGLGLRATLRRGREEFLRTLREFRKPNLYDLSSPSRVGCIYREPNDMCETDRLMLFALVRGLRPNFALEIGARWGNSARIITNAMEENGVGRLIGIDPFPEAFSARPRELHGRYTLLKGYSPQAIPEAAKTIGHQFEFVFIDALHIYDAVLADFRGCLPHLADGAHVLFHDAYHQGVAEAIGTALAENLAFNDCGLITRDASIGFPVSYGGMRLLRKGGVDSKELISAAYQRNNHTPPPFSREVWNYDPYYNRLQNSDRAQQIRNEAMSES